MIIIKNEQKCECKVLIKIINLFSKIFSKHKREVIVDQDHHPLDRTLNPDHDLKVAKKGINHILATKEEFLKKKYPRSRSGSFKRSRRSPSPYHRSRHSGSSNYGGHDRINPTASNVLGIFGLSMHTSERDLKDIFSKYGKLTQVRLIIDKRVN